MNYEISFSADQGVVRINVYESITGQLELSFAEEAIAAAKRNGVLRYLADVRGVPTVASPSEQYTLAYEDMKRLGLDRASRIAILVGQGDHSHDFVGMVFRNAGYVCQLFAHEDDARDWLGR